jgi:hypothetical protein
VQHGGTPGGEVGRDRAHPLHRGQGRARLVEQPPAVAGERDPPRRPLQQPYAQLPFEPADLLAHRGLRDVQPLGARPKCSSSATATK